MSRYDLVINGTPITVEILSVSGGQATVSVNGSTFQVKLPAGASAPAPRPSRVATPAQAVSAGPKPVKEAPPRPAAPVAPPAAVEGEEILAPMPGQVVKVLVRVGDDVGADTPVVLMEAMKMENEIRSHVTGRVAAVRVSEGQTVRVNEVLVVIGAS
jgi:biotin carboxyl carrier protein